MEGSAFDVTETDDVLEQAFKSCTAASGAKLHLGPDLARMMTQRKHDHVQIVEAVRQSVRYAYVSHYYGNPLSVFGLDTKIEDLREQDIEAIRMLPSFRQYIERLLDEKQAAKVRRLLNSNEVLAEELWDAIITANTNLEWLCGALSIIEHVQGHIVETGSGRSALPYFTLYIKALSGSLNSSSPSIRELLLSIEKLDSDAAASIIKYIADTLISMPPSCHDISPDSFSDLQEELSELTQQHGLLKPPSFLNPGTTTISAPSTNLKPSTKKPHNPSKTSGAATRISPHLRSYTTLLTRLHDLLKSFFSSALPTVPFNHPNFFVPPAPAAAATKPHHQLHWNPTEVLFLTTPTRSLLKSAMTPSPRHAIERALSRPHDYLGCACCGPNRRSDAVSNVSAFNGDEGDNGRILAEEKNDHQPATAILYQLYLESGTLINVGDLWMAFRARVSPSVGAATKTNGRDAGWGDGAGGLDGDADGMSVDGSGDQGARGGMDGDGITADDAKGTNSQGRSEHREQMTRALFVRALAELKYLGMIRATRRRNDCVQKVLWKGL